MKGMTVVRNVQIHILALHALRRGQHEENMEIYLILNMIWFIVITFLNIIAGYGAICVSILFVLIIIKGFKALDKILT